MVKTDMACSPSLQRYFDELEEKTHHAFTIASQARAKGYDPEPKVEIKLAKNMAERVVGIISVVAPQIAGSGVTQRIMELEKEYGLQDWRVAFKIALEIAQEKYCSFEDKIEAIEVGVRTGFAYVTVGVVSSPLEGLTSIEIRKRRDGKGEYFRLNYAGPIRNAGGTAAAVSVLIADYVRKHLGYAKYDPDEKEVLRCQAELEDYHQYVANLQYFPFKEESAFLMRHIPVEIAGDPSERRELSNAMLKDLSRIETNYLRSGYCLIHSSCIPLKSPKLWKKLLSWRHEMGMHDWDFLGDHTKLQKELKARQAATADDSDEHDDKEQKVKPDGVFVADLVGGRPVLSHPMRSGGFRLRYGRSRVSGYSGQSVHPATLLLLDGMIATGTQLKVERPGKATVLSPCDTLMGPTVKLRDGSVVYVKDASQAKRLRDDVEEILYLGDVLINYGDFFDRAHILVPPGYVEEWWALEAERAVGDRSPPADLSRALRDPLRGEVSFAQAEEWSAGFGIPLHPAHLFFYKELSLDRFRSLASWLVEASFSLGERPRISLPAESPDGKRALELLGVPHRVVDGSVVLEGDVAAALAASLDVRTGDDARSLVAAVEAHEGDVLSLVQGRAPFSVRDKSGLFIGARMGRPEKAKMRKMTGSPHTLFPVGEEGGRLRSFQSALEKGRVTADFPVFVCPSCKRTTPLSVCDKCGSKTVRQLIHPQSGEVLSPEEAEDRPDVTFAESKQWKVPINELFDYCLKKLGTRVFPDLVKGVRGTVSRDNTPEHVMKGILRAKHDVHVNKDGTVRYDASELALTHFKPKEVGTGVPRLRELGYTRDIHGRDVVDEDQVLELRAQDLVLPACPVSPDVGSDEVLVHTSQFIDEELQFLYGLTPFYNVRSREDLVGHLVVGLAPHTSAGIVGRIIGFSSTQGMLAHPLYHAAMRRDADGDESCFFLLMDAFLNFSQRYLSSSRGSTMDAPLVLTSLLNPAEVDDMAFNVDIVDRYPLEFYEACAAYSYPWDVQIKKIGDVLFTPEQFEGMLFTHDTDDFNAGVLCSTYKLLPSMGEKIASQMALAEKLRAVDTSDVARLVIEKHFIRDTKGNLRKFSLQQFRCVHCNEKFRRPPLQGRCTSCGGRVIFTIAEGSVVKYLEPSLLLAEKYNLDPYLRQTLELTKVRVESYFGREKEKQVALGEWLGGGRSRH
ncbi:DNA polymerase II large subunit [Candidatus Woesearchaeota archaeon]|nr:DNA polymerase II large subunit [Candidatus Woesearchaeota archaeon]